MTHGSACLRNYEKVLILSSWTWKPREGVGLWCSLGKWADDCFRSEGQPVGSPGLGHGTPPSFLPAPSDTSGWRSCQAPQSTEGHGRSRPHYVRMSTQFLSTSLQMKGLGIGMAEGTGLQLRLFSPCRAPRSPSTLRSITEQRCKREGNGWVKGNPVTEHESCPSVFTFSKSENQKRVDVGKFPRNRKA